MIESKLAYRNVSREIYIYMLMIVCNALFIAFIIGYQSVLSNDAFNTFLMSNNVSEKKIFLNIIIKSIAALQYIILIFYMKTYYNIINKKRIRQLALYKIIGYKRKSIRAIIFFEGLYIYIISIVLAIILALFINKGIVIFTNNYVNLDTLLSTELSVTSIISSSLFLLFIIVLNCYSTYKHALNIDIEDALNEHQIQKKVECVPKFYVYVSGLSGLILILLMTKLSFVVSYTIRYGIIFIGIFYAIGLYLLINSFAKGYRYLFSARKKSIKYNRLLFSEINFYLSKSKLLILSSIILMMMSIGALLLSQIMAYTYNNMFLASDYMLFTEDLNVMSSLDYNIDVTLDVDGVESYANFSIYPTELVKYVTGTNNIENYTIYIDENYSGFDGNLNELLDEASKIKVLLDDTSYDVNILELPIEGELINGHTNILTIPLAELQSNDLYEQYQLFIDKVKIMYSAVLNEQLKYSVIEQTYPSLNENYQFSSTAIMPNSDFNSYLALFNKKPINLKENQVIVDGSLPINLNNLNVVKYTTEGFNSLVVSDSLYNQLKNSSIYSIYFVATSDQAYELVNNELLTIEESFRPFRNNRAAKNEMIGYNAFILLIAFYIAVILIITNFTLIAISLISHAIEQRKIYKKLTDIGLNKLQLNKFVSIVINTVFGLPLIIGTISGLIVTNFAVKLFFMSYALHLNNIKMIIITLVSLYIILYVLILSITKYVYIKIISEH